MQLFTVRASQSHRSVMYGGSKTEQEKWEEDRSLFTGCTCLKILFFYIYKSGFRSNVLFELCLIICTAITLLLLLQKELILLTEDEMHII